MVAELYHESRPGMGTIFDLYLYAESSSQARDLFELAFDEIERLEATLSNRKTTSEIARLNREARAVWVVTDPETFALLRRAREYGRLTDGAFDITVGRLMQTWGFSRQQGRLPSAEEIAAAQAGWDLLLLDEETRAVGFASPAVELDLGGIGKGYALDQVADLWREHGVSSALLVAGRSSICALGAPLGKTAWTVRVPHPFDESTISTISVRDGAVSTSGSYEKFFRAEGKTYCHILDPRTGWPVQGMLQTTVVAANATDAEALSTALFVLGPTHAPALLEMARAAALIVAEGMDVTRFYWREASA
ncbi:FAD:protein FMN transferase [Pyrinomonas sp.]|uniref:FAD:protein FMN transferase n=1 Tax=Pyrinomonas sp. TaxID=2080306 RepID=UPI00331952DB